MRSFYLTAISGIIVFLGGAVDTVSAQTPTCNPRDFITNYHGETNLAQQLALRQLFVDNNMDTRRQDEGISVLYDATPVGAQKNSASTSNSHKLHEFAFSSDSHFSSNTAIEYLSPLYKDCLLYNSDGLRLQLSAGGPGSETVAIHADWRPKSGVEPSQFKFTVTGSGKADKTGTVGPFLSGTGQQNLLITGRKDEETLVLVEMVGRSGAIFASDLVTIPKRPRIFGPNPVRSERQEGEDFSFPSPRTSDFHSKTYQVSKPNTIFVAENGNYTCSTHCGSYGSFRFQLSNDNKTITVLGAGINSDGSGGSGGGTLHLTLTEETTTMEDVTDRPFVIRSSPNSPQ